MEEVEEMWISAGQPISHACNYALRLPGFRLQTSSDRASTLPTSSCHSLGMTKFSAAEWARLGQAVYEARSEAGLSKTTEWASAVQRSSRVLLGLERGESVGSSTLTAIEDALGWPRGGCFRVLTGGVPWRELTVSGDAQTHRDYVSGPDEKVEGGDSDEGVLGAINAMRRDMQNMEQRLSERLDRLEERGS